MPPWVHGNFSHPLLPTGLLFPTWPTIGLLWV
jgi:hypothetical protein